jgi:single-stranded DNA-binding protein
MNSVQLIGHLTRAPTTRFEGEGVQVATFTLSVPETSQGGKRWTLYVPCTAYGRSADQASLLSAEDLVSIQGRLGWHKRQGKCGTEHSTLVVNVKEIVPLQGAVVETAAPVGWGHRGP